MANNEGERRDLQEPLPPSITDGFAALTAAPGAKEGQLKPLCACVRNDRGVLICDLHRYAVDVRCRREEAAREVAPGAKEEARRFICPTCQHAHQFTDRCGSVVDSGHGVCECLYTYAIALDRVPSWEAFEGRWVTCEINDDPHLFDRDTCYGVIQLVPALGESEGNSSESDGKSRPGVWVQGIPLSDAQLDGAHIIDKNGKDLGLLTGFVPGRKSEELQCGTCGRLDGFHEIGCPFTSSPTTLELERAVKTIEQIAERAAAYISAKYPESLRGRPIEAFKGRLVICSIHAEPHFFVAPDADDPEVRLVEDPGKSAGTCVKCRQPLLLAFGQKHCHKCGAPQL